MNDIVILTATYNHPKELEQLFMSLIGQTNNNFIWLIVNDGSTSRTNEILSKIKKSNKVKTSIISQSNAGKGRAINNGLDHLPMECKFVLIVDDDEQLYPETIEILKHYIMKYKDTPCGVINFYRKDMQGDVIAHPVFRKDFFMSLQKFSRKGYHSDGYIGYFVDKLKSIRFSIYDGEKYIGPSTLIMKVTKKSQLLWSTKVLGRTEYLSGGITKQGRKLRLENPLGMIEYCSLWQHKDSGLKKRFFYSIQAFAYLDFVSKDKKESVRIDDFLSYTKFLGQLLAWYWRKKYFNN